MANNKGQMSNDVFQKLIKEDYWIDHIARPVNCCDRNGKHKHWRTCTYPDEYIIDEEQIAVAKREYERRHDEELANIKRGDLCFVAMGMGFTPIEKNGVGNYRIRCEFKNVKGKQFFIEFSLASNKQDFYVEYSIERGQEDIYNAMGVSNSTYVRATWNNILQFVNDRYGCTYQRTKLFNYFVTTDEYVNQC